jgi:hypothetical protein
MVYFEPCERIFHLGSHLTDRLSVPKNGLVSEEIGSLKQGGKESFSSPFPQEMVNQIHSGYDLSANNNYAGFFKNGSKGKNYDCPSIQETSERFASLCALQSSVACTSCHHR